MTDPRKRSDNVDPVNVPGNRPVDLTNRPVNRNRRKYSWAWVVVIIIVLLIIWAFFGRNYGTRDVISPAQPATAPSAVR